MTTNAYIGDVEQRGWPRSAGWLWQQNDYEHVIRNDEDLDSIRQYIINNPLKWSLNNENPATHDVSP